MSTSANGAFNRDEVISFAQILREYSIHSIRQSIIVPAHGTFTVVRDKARPRREALLCLSWSRRLSPARHGRIRCVITSVAAILTVGDGYALQLRDHLPAIPFPGHWGFFGGAVDRDETPVAAVRREVVEELGLDVVQWAAVWQVPYRHFFDGQACVVEIFTADLTGRWGAHVLREGRACGVFRADRLPSPMIPLAATLLVRYQRERGNVRR